MGGLNDAGDVANGSVGAAIADVGRGAAGIPAEKKAGPAMMVHGDRLAGWRGYFEHADEFVFKDDLVGIGRGLDGVVSVGKSGFILAVEIEVSRGKQEQSRGGEGEYSAAPKSAGEVHAAQYRTLKRQAVRAPGAGFGAFALAVEAGFGALALTAEAVTSSRVRLRRAIFCLRTRWNRDRSPLRPDMGGSLEFEIQSPGTLRDRDWGK